MIELIVFFLFLNIGAFFLMGGVLLNPINILGMGFLISSFALFFSRKVWLVILSQGTIDLIIYSTIFFCIGVLVPFYLSLSTKKNSCSLKLADDSNTVLKIKNIFVLNRHIKLIINITILFQFSLLILLYMQLRKFTSGGSLSNIIAYYRNVSMSTDTSAVALPVWLNQGLRLGRACAYVLTFLEIFKIIVEKEKIEISYFLPVLLYVLQTLLMGGRLQLIRVFMFVACSSYFLSLFESGTIRKANKLIFKATIWGIIFLPFFYSLKGLLGRTSTDTFLQYIGRYLGGPIESLDLFLKTGIHGQHLMGQETFSGIYGFFSKFNSGGSNVTLNWIESPNGVWVGNVYTGLRRYYADFGTIGSYALMLVLGLIFGTIFTIIVRKIQLKKLKGFSLIFYSYFIYSLFFQFFEETFFSTGVTVGTIVQLIEMFFFYRILLMDRKTS